MTYARIGVPRRAFAAPHDVCDRSTPGCAGIDACDSDSGGGPAFWGSTIPHAAHAGEPTRFTARQFGHFHVFVFTRPIMTIVARGGNAKQPAPRRRGSRLELDSIVSGTPAFALEHRNELFH